jgi:SpoVK/Ycf46/Vps4 family AAA+-type ATPase
MQGYHTGRQHLFEELYRLDLRLNVQIARQRRNPASANFDEFRGLFISEDDIDLILGHSQGEQTHQVAEDEPEMQRLEAAIEGCEQQIAARTAPALEQGVHLPLRRLAELFNLTPFDIEALLVCLAPELDLKYEKLYAYLQNDVTRKRPSMGLILDLLCRSLEEKLQARTRLVPKAPLLRGQLVRFASDEHQSSLSRALRIDDRILNYLLEVDTLDEGLMPFTRLVAPSASLEALVLPADFKATLLRLFRSGIDAEQQRTHLAPVFLFEGPAGVGKKFSAEALCRWAGLKLLIADVPELLLNGSLDTSLTTRLFREATLQAAALYLDQAGTLLAENEKAAHARRVLFKVLEEFPAPVFVGSEQAWDAVAYPQVESFSKVVFPRPDYGLRRQLWQTYLVRGGQPVAGDVDLDELAAKFNFTAGHIRAAAAEAQQLAMRRDHGAATISSDDVYQACRSQSSTRLATLTRKIIPLYTWDDIILPDRSLQLLREMCAHARYRQQVFGRWGFDQKMSLGKGLSALFIGPSGTGKTMAAEIIAGELSLDLYKIDLSGVVSKYIGETEKNLNRIFEEAEQSNAILFFDEADALFGKRSQVKDAHDRYANIEINYLLQKMEEYEGITVLTSNFQRNIDEAFTRRLRFIVEFPVPDESHRYRIWKNIFPADTPLGDDIDYDFLARKLKITGGNIRNIALNTAFLAAANSGVVDMEHIVHSTKREFEKLGRLCVKADFEQYYDWVKDEE